MRKAPEIDDDDAFLSALVAKSRGVLGRLPSMPVPKSLRPIASVEFSMSASDEIHRHHNEGTQPRPEASLSVDSQAVRPAPRQRKKQQMHSPMSLVKSKQRVADHGEVFTPPWLVEAMLDLVKGEAERIDARFLEPACGSGNFLVRILERKLAAVELKFGKSDFERRQYALLALMSIYGIELLADNIAECRANMLETLASYLKLDPADGVYRAASHVLSQNLVHGNALTMRAYDDGPITFTEWGYLGKGKFQRRDFRLDVLAGSLGFREDGSPFASLGKHAIFTPIKTYRPMTMNDLAALDEVAKEAV